MPQRMAISELGVDAEVVERTICRVRADRIGRELFEDGQERRLVLNCEQGAIDDRNIIEPQMDPCPSAAQYDLLFRDYADLVIDFLHALYAALPFFRSVLFSSSVFTVPNNITLPSITVAVIPSVENSGSSDSFLSIAV